MRKLLIALSLMLAACAQDNGGGGGSSSAVRAPKPLFSRWTNGAVILDAVDADFGATTVWFILGQNMGCQCNNMTLTGDENSGVAQINACTPVGGVSCGEFISTWYYTKTSDRLILCGPTNLCYEYQ